MHSTDALQLHSTVEEHNCSYTAQLQSTFALQLHNTVALPLRLLEKNQVATKNLKLQRPNLLDVR